MQDALTEVVQWANGSDKDYIDIAYINGELNTRINWLNLST